MGFTVGGIPLAPPQVLALREDTVIRAVLTKVVRSPRGIEMEPVLSAALLLSLLFIETGSLLIDTGLKLTM